MIILKIFCFFKRLNENCVTGFVCNMQLRRNVPAITLFFPGDTKNSRFFQFKSIEDLKQLNPSSSDLRACALTDNGADSDCVLG